MLFVVLESGCKPDRQGTQQREREREREREKLIFNDSGFGSLTVLSMIPSILSSKKCFGGKCIINKRKTI